MCSHLERSDVDLLRSILLFLDTQSWQPQENETRLSEALVKISDMF